MNVDTLLSGADLPLTTTDTEAALAATVERGRRRRRGRKLATGCAAAALVALLSGAVLSIDRGDRHQVVAGPPITDTTVPTVPEPGDVAVWDVDPDDRDSLGTATSLTALVTRLGCSSGVTGRVLRPGVVVTDTEVIVTFTVASNPAGGECPANDQVPYEVEIGQPIGDRALVDGACLGTRAMSTSFCRSGAVRWRPEVTPSVPECPEHTRPPVPLPIRFSTLLPDGEVRVSGEDPQWIVFFDRTINTTVTVLVTATADPGVVLGSLDYELVDSHGDVVHTYRGSSASLGEESTGLTWDGTGPEGEAAPPGRYHLTAEAVVARDEGGGDCYDATGSRIGSGLGYFRVT